MKPCQLLSTLLVPIRIQARFLQGGQQILLAPPVVKPPRLQACLPQRIHRDSSPDTAVPPYLFQLILGLVFHVELRLVGPEAELAIFWVGRVLVLEYMLSLTLASHSARYIASRISRGSREKKGDWDWWSHV